MKQTAVEWLANELYLSFEMKGDGALFNDLLNQAKEMEKQQIKTSFRDGFLNNDKNSEQYYNETFNK
jgi:hypothetical protein